MRVVVTTIHHAVIVVVVVVNVNPKISLSLSETLFLSL